MERLKQALSAAGIAYKENEPLSAHCTFRIGGPADVFILPENEAQLCAAIKLAKEANIKYYLLGNGSNILFEDAGYRGAVINVSAMKSAIGILVKHLFPGQRSGPDLRCCRCRCRQDALVALHDGAGKQPHRS